MILAWLLVLSACGGSGTHNTALLRFVRCVRATPDFDTSSAAANDTFASILLTAQRGDVSVTVAAYRLPASPSLQKTIHQLGSTSGTKYRFHGHGLGGIAITAYAQQPGEGGPTVYSRSLRTLIDSCLRSSR